MVKQSFAVFTLAVSLNSALAANETRLSDATENATAPKMTEVVVTASTGSFIERNISKQPIPVLSIGRDDIAKNGYPSISRTLEQLSISPTAYIRQDQVSHGGTVAGVKTINLRGPPALGQGPFQWCHRAHPARSPWCRL